MEREGREGEGGRESDIVGWRERGREPERERERERERARARERVEGEGGRERGREIQRERKREGGGNRRNTLKVKISCMKQYYRRKFNAGPQTLFIFINNHCQTVISKQNV